MTSGCPAVKTRATYWPKPIPIRRFDWVVTFDDYEPGQPIGYGETEHEALADLLDQVEPPPPTEQET